MPDVKLFSCYRSAPNFWLGSRTQLNLICTAMSRCSKVIRGVAAHPQSNAVEDSSTVLEAFNAKAQQLSKCMVRRERAANETVRGELVLLGLGHQPHIPSRS
jgi:hypothetical protein